MSTPTTPFDSMIPRDYREIGMEPPLARYTRKRTSNHLYTRMLDPRGRGRRAAAAYRRALRRIDPALKFGLACFYAPNGWMPAGSAR